MNQLKTIRAASGETIKVTNKWAAEAESRGTTVSTSAWEFSGSGTPASAALTSTTATCLLTPTSCGCLTNTVTLANGEVLKAKRDVAMSGHQPMDYV